MKQVTKKSLLSFLVVALLAIVCAFGVMGFNRSNTALANEALPEKEVYQAATLADEADFSIKAGAGVETTTTGIKFTAIVSETFAEAGYSYFATAQVKGGTKVMEAAFTAAPVFNEGVAEICVYINGFGEMNDAQKVAAAKAEWIVNAYAYNETACYVAANGGEDNLQSMRMVAANAALDYTSPEVDGYDKEDITSYFVKSSFAEGVNGYAADDGIVQVSFAGAPVDATEIYINGIAANPDLEAGEIFYNEENARYWVYSEAFGAEELNTIGKAVLFTADGGVYATKIARGTPISSEADMKTYFTGDVEGYYFLVSDIAMTSVWTVIANLYGTVDGQGYVITNVKYNNGNYHALFDPYGGTIRNIGIQVASAVTHSGLVFGSSGDLQDSFMENVFVDACPKSERNSLHQFTLGGTHTQKNVILNKKQSGSTSVSYTASCHDNKSTAGTYGVHVFENVHVTANVSANISKGVNGYATSGDLYRAIRDKDIITTFEQARAISVIQPWYEVNQENAVEVFTNYAINNNTLILTGDIDFGGTPIAHAATTAWNGTLDGNGFTISNSKNVLFGGYVNNGAIIRNLKVKNSINQHGVFAGQCNSGVVTFENVGVSIAGRVSSYSSLIGQGSGASYVIKNVLVVNPLTGAYDGILTNNIYTGTYNISNLFAVATVGLQASAAKDTHGAATFGGYKTLDGSADAVADVDYHIYANATLLADAMLAGTVEIPEEVSKLIVELGLVVPINQENAIATFTAGLTSGYYYLEEDVDLTDSKTGNASTINATTTFTGIFNGNGYTIRNVNTKGLFGSAMNGKAVVKNVGFYGVTPAGTGGVLSGQANSGNACDILVEDVVVNMHNTTGSYGLIGQSVGMKVRFNNVVVNFENSNSKTAGYVGCTSLSGTKIFNKFIGIGSIATVTNATSRPDAVNNTHIAGFYGGGDNGWGTGWEKGPDGTSAPVKDQDYFNFANYAEFEAKLENNAFGLSDNALALLEKTGMIRKLTKDNIGILRTATNGSFYLAEDIDMNEVDLNGDGIPGNDVWTAGQCRSVPFVGTLDGKGHSITNLKIGGKNYNGLFGTVGGGALIKDIKIECVELGHINAVLIGMVNTGYAANATFTMNNGGVKGEINVVNTVIVAKDLKGTKAVVTVFYNATPTIKLTDVVVVAGEVTDEVYVAGTYDKGYLVTDGGGNTANLTVDNVLVVVAETETSWVDDGSNTAEKVLTGELTFATDLSTIGAQFEGNSVVLKFFNLDPK